MFTSTRSYENPPLFFGKPREKRDMRKKKGIDYSTFGAPMPGRSYSSSSYRYGFNGQEKDDEIATGIYTAEFWEYDARLGRRWNTDPVVKEWISPYSTFGNSPIINSDRNGDDWYRGADGTVEYFETRRDIDGYTHLGQYQYYEEGQYVYFSLWPRPGNSKPLLVPPGKVRDADWFENWLLRKFDQVEINLLADAFGTDGVNNNKVKEGSPGATVSNKMREAIESGKAPDQTIDVLMKNSDGSYQKISRGTNGSFITDAKYYLEGTPEAVKFGNSGDGNVITAAEVGTYGTIYTTKEDADAFFKAEDKFIEKVQIILDQQKEDQ